MNWRSSRAIVLVAMAALCLAVVSRGGKPAEPNAEPLQTSVYVWQRAWTDSVRDAVGDAGPSVDSFMVLAGELGTGEIRPDWQAIAETGRAATLVLRIPERFGDEMHGEALGDFVAELVGGFASLMDSAEASGAKIAGIQLDFDSPTSKLERYGRFLAALRSEWPDTALSFTALPTWLGSDDFERVARNADYFVLQVHALEAPAAVGDPLQLCDVGKLDGYLRRASSVGVPYYLALPTYGYRVAFKPDGVFAGLTAEGPAPVWPSDYSVRELRADPAEMAAVAKGIYANPPPYCIGLTWFRLPIREDSLNWSWPTLRAVMQGDIPASEVHAELRTPEPGLTEVWLRHDGGTETEDSLRIPLGLSGIRVMAWDVLNGFESIRGDDGVVTLTGRVRRNNSPMMIAWFRHESSQKGISILTENLENAQ